MDSRTRLEEQRGALILALLAVPPTCERLQERRRFLTSGHICELRQNICCIVFLKQKKLWNVSIARSALSPYRRLLSGKVRRGKRAEADERVKVGFPVRTSAFSRVCLVKR